MPTFELRQADAGHVASLYLFHEGRKVNAATFKWAVRCRYCGEAQAAPGHDQCVKHLGVSRASAQQQAERGRGWCAYLCLQEALITQVQPKYEASLLDVKLRLLEVMEDANSRKRPFPETLQRVHEMDPNMVQASFERASLSPLLTARFTAYVLLRVEAGLLHGRNAQPRRD